MVLTQIWKHESTLCSAVVNDKTQQVRGNLAHGVLSTTCSLAGRKLLCYTQIWKHECTAVVYNKNIFQWSPVESTILEVVEIYERTHVGPLGIMIQTFSFFEFYFLRFVCVHFLWKQILCAFGFLVGASH